MRMQIYNALVNRHSGIRERYHRIHDGGDFKHKIASYAYLLGMNLQYYLFRKKSLDMPEQTCVYEEKRLLCEESESVRAGKRMPSAEEYAERLSKYDVVSFDIFDTLIFRPFSEPADVFHFIGLELGIMDFKRIRIEQEYLARQEKLKAAGHCEVTLAEIWRRMEQELGISAEYGMQLEKTCELKFCYANPFMRKVFQGLQDRLQNKNRKIIAVSDMYMPSDFLLQLLEENGYTGIEKLYVSCEHAANKAAGKLFGVVKEDFKGASLAHVGDNRISDIRMAEKAGFAAFFYPNVNRKSDGFRAHDMSPVTGGAYRGIVANHIYCGLYRHSMEYEYGYIYGGLFAIGYCRFIHEYCREHGIDRLLFLSRDGDILKKVYDRLYPNENTSYVLWSRAAATKLMAEYNRYDYFRRFIYHKVNQKKRIRDILSAMELEELAELLDAEADGWEADGQQAPEGPEADGLRASDWLTDQNADALKRFLLKHFDRVLSCYEGQRLGAKVYYERELAGCSRAAAIDIGWAGSGAVSLSYLAERVWRLPCEITGIIAGTNTIHNAEPDAGEMFLQSGKLVSYLFSQSNNRDVMKKHDPNKDYNIFWELLLSSPARQFVGFSAKRGNGKAAEGEAAEDMEASGDIRAVCRFGKEDANRQGILEVQQGILDFVSEYLEHFADFPYMLSISGRDACAPMLAAAGQNERYLRAIERLFNMERNVN